MDKNYANIWFDFLGGMLNAIPSMTYLWECAQDHVLANEQKEIKKYENLIYLLHNSVLSPYTKLGKGVKFGYGGIGIVVHKNCIIGDYVSIGQNVTLGGSPGKVTITEDGYRTSTPILKDHAYIGAGSKIIGGVVVGKYSIVGANSVVNKDIPDYSICAGNPAKIIGALTKENCLKYKSLFYYFKDKQDNEYISNFV